MRYYRGVFLIKSFVCNETKALFECQVVRKIPFELQRSALRKLKMLDAAGSLDELRIPPGNRLEKLKGKRSGQYSIRINDQWRICFYFEGAGAAHVEIVDYH